MPNQPQDLVITGLGCVTASGIGLDAQWQAATESRAKESPEAYSLKDFKAAPHMSDRRMLKAVSNVDAIGLAAIEGLKKTLKWEPRPYTPERTGLYVGAPPASAFDNSFYVDAMEATRNDKGEYNASDFGKTCMSAMPMTLLVGLPNNVLCYGSMIFDAKGPNSNYTSLANGGHMALINGARRVRRNQLSIAVTGGFSAHTELVNSSMLAKLGVDCVLADGAAFVAVERRDAATARGADILATYRGGAMASDGLGPLQQDESGSALESVIQRALAEAGLAPQDIGLVLAGAGGFAPSDLREFSVLSRVFANERDFPALGSSSRLLGQLSEAGGLIEVGLAARIHRDGQVPQAMAPGSFANDSKFSRKVPENKPYSLVLRTSPWGEYSAIVIGP